MNASTNISLKVPFNEKDQAKALGARWNAEMKLWYVPQGVDAAPFEKWFTATPVAITAKAVTAVNSNSKPVTSKSATQDQPLDDDMDAINAKLRDAYELREFDAEF